MCNDYAREIEAAHLIEYMAAMQHTPPFGWAGGRIPNDIAPQPHVKIHDKGLIVRRVSGQLECSMTRWAWDQGKRPVYNFKSEDRDFSSTERCLISATAFYEYTDSADARPKVKLKDQHRFTMTDQPFFWIAGIVKADCFAMLTTQPGPDIAPFHDRQIVVLPPVGGLAWLTLSLPESLLLATAPTGTLHHQLVRKNGVGLE